MPGLSLIQPETAAGETARLLAAAQDAFGVTSNLAKAMANSPCALKGYLDLFTALGSGNLPRSTRQSIALLVAQENQCDYCLSMHAYIATKVAGLTSADAVLAREGRSSDRKTAAALALAAALVRDHGGIADGELAAAQASELSDEEITEIVAHVSLNIFTNYFSAMARVDIDWPLVRHARNAHSNGEER